MHFIADGLADMDLQGEGDQLMQGCKSHQPEAEGFWKPISEILRLQRCRVPDL